MTNIPMTVVVCVDPQYGSHTMLPARPYHIAGG